ncbi:MAG: DUF58 domain-containing protein [Planctomycetes bacterium]|nr:DUF58 domain-containing protein [Planctomycetota bacterium]
MSEHTLDELQPLDARRFEVAVKRLADGLRYGTDRSPFVGSGLEFAQSRPYHPGDPVRRIDWRVTARRGRVFVKEYETLRALPVYLVVDTSASMTVSSTPRSKYRLAVEVAGGLALACLERVSPVGLIGAGGRSLHAAPSLSREQVFQWLHQLRRYRLDEPTRLATRLVELGQRALERSVVFVLSDLHDPAALGALRRLGHAHDVAVIQLRDPAEDTLAGGGLVFAREAETGVAFVTRGRATQVDDGAARQSLRRAGIDHLLLRTLGPVRAPLRQFLASRGLLGRGSR